MTTITKLSQTKAELEASMEILHDPEYMCSAERYGEWARVLADLKNPQDPPALAARMSSDEYGVFGLEITGGIRGPGRPPHASYLPTHIIPVHIPVPLPNDMVVLLGTVSTFILAIEALQARVVDLRPRLAKYELPEVGATVYVNFYGNRFTKKADEQLGDGEYVRLKGGRWGTYTGDATNEIHIFDTWTPLAYEPVAPPLHTLCATCGILSACPHKKPLHDSCASRVVIPGDQ